MADNLSDLQPAIMVSVDGKLHVLSIVTLRTLVRGERFEGDCDQLIKILAKFIVDSYD